MKRFLFFLMLPICFSGCDINPLDHGPQPGEITPIVYQPKLSVFGLLRPDSLLGLPLSFVHVEQSYPSSDVPDSTIIADAQVRIMRMKGMETVEVCSLQYDDYGVFPAREYRAPNLFANAGTFRIVCEKQGFPVVTGETTMPSIPAIQEGTLRLAENRLSFTIIRDPQAALYEVALVGQTRTLANQRFLRPATGNIIVTLDLTDVPHEVCRLVIYAFDLNLSEYLTCNLSIKPNIFQRDFSTVENGYGCFGSVNIYSQDVQL